MVKQAFLLKKEIKNQFLLKRKPKRLHRGKSVNRLYTIHKKTGKIEEIFS